LFEALVIVVALAVLGLALGGRALLGGRTVTAGEDTPAAPTPGTAAMAAEPGAAPAEKDLWEPADADPGRAASAGNEKRAEAEASGRSQHTDVKAVEYFEKRWGKKDKAINRVKDIRTVGGYLRIYTDLPESADNSKKALTLCERGLKYLVDELGTDNPVVFVHSSFGENGNPVLANILGRGDKTCRVTYPKPKG
jgi:hypothetical protein